MVAKDKIKRRLALSLVIRLIIRCIRRSGCTVQHTDALRHKAAMDWGSYSIHIGSLPLVWHPLHVTWLFRRDGVVGRLSRPSEKVLGLNLFSLPVGVLDQTASNLYLLQCTGSCFRWRGVCWVANNNRIPTTCDCVSNEVPLMCLPKCYLETFPPAWVPACLVIGSFRWQVWVKSLTAGGGHVITLTFCLPGAASSFGYWR